MDAQTGAREVVTRESITAQVIEQRTNKIRGIRTHGLLPATELRQLGINSLASYDRSPVATVEGSIFPHDSLDFPESVTLQSDMIDALYNSPFSSIRVVCERDYEQGDPEHALSEKYHDPQKVKKILEDRANASILIVSHNDRKNLRHGPTRKKVGRDAFLKILIPTSVWESLPDSEKVEDPSIELIPDTVTRSLQFYDKAVELTVPNYEAAILKLWEGRKEPMWLHGVRLPIKDDLGR